MLKHLKRRSLKAKLAFWSAAAMVVVVLAVTSFALWILRADMNRSAVAVQAALADGVARELDALVAERRLALSQSASVLGAEALTEREAFRKHFASRPVLQGMFDVLFVVDRDGRIVFDAPELVGRVGRSVADRDYFRAVMATGRPAVSQPLAGRASNEPNIVFAAPLITPSGQIVGALGGIVYLTRPNFLTALGNVKIGQTGYVAVLSKGDPAMVIVHPQRDRVLTPVPAPDQAPLAHRGLRGEEGTFEGTNSVGLEALFSFRSLESVPWVVTTAFPLSEAHVELRNSQRLVIALGLAMMLLAGAGIWLLVDRLLVPLDRLRTAMVASRNQSEPVLADVRDQTRELYEVADAFNTLMAHKEAARAELLQNKTRLRLITDSVPAQILYIDTERRVTFANAHLGGQMGVPTPTLLGKHLREVRGEVLYDQVVHRLDGAFAGQETSFEGRYDRRGRPAWYRTSYVPDVDENGLVRGVVSMTQDITAQKRAEIRLRTIADNLPVLIAYIDSDERMQFANATYRTWAGVDPQAAIGRKVSELVPAHLYDERHAWLQRALSGERVEFEIESDAMGVRRHLNTVYVPDVREDGRVAGVYALSSDVSALKRVEASLSAQARVDPLTELANRRAFDERLRDSVARNRRQRQHMALLFIDVDHFKRINDTHGHGAGDAVLREFARRMQQCVRQTDTVARLAGDEFVLILEGLSSVDEAVQLATKLGQRLREPVAFDGSEVSVSASIGVAYVDDPRMAPEDIVARADRALYRAKGKGRDTFSVTTV